METNYTYWHHVNNRHIYIIPISINQSECLFTTLTLCIRCFCHFSCVKVFCRNEVKICNSCISNDRMVVSEESDSRKSLILNLRHVHAMIVDYVLPSSLHPLISFDRLYEILQDSIAWELCIVKCLYDCIVIYINSVRKILWLTYSH